jgi:viologen exporter family transport system permease protein
VERISIAWTFFRICAMNELQYRVNFILQLFQSLLSIAISLITLWLIYSHTSTLHGWTSAQLLIVMGIFTMMGGVIQATIQPNMMRLMSEIQQGTLDFAITKPVDTQLVCSVREVEIWEAVDVLTGLILVAVGVARLQSQVGLMEALAFLFVLGVGAVLVYCFWMILTSLAFWVTGMWHLVDLFQGVYNAGRYPVVIYPGWLRYGLTFLVPVAFAVTVPAEALTGRLTWQTFTGAIALALGFLALTRLVWRLGLHRYSGASA